MQNKLAPNDELLTVAEHGARDTEYLRLDIAATLFPKSNQGISEEMLAAIRRDSQAVIRSLSAAINGGGVLAVDAIGRDDQRMLHDGSALLEFLYGRYCFARLEKKLAMESDIPLSQTLPALLLSDADHHIADCGQIILAVSGMMRRGATPEWNELPADLLHQLCWRIVAMSEHKEGQNGDDTGSDRLRANAHNLLSNYSESQRLSVAAQKFIHLSGNRYAEEKNDVARSGLAIFIAKLASKLDLSANHIVQLIGSSSLCVFAVLQRAAGIDKIQAMANIHLLYGFDLTPHDITLFDQGYTELSEEQAQKTVTGWHIIRMQKTAFGDDLSDYPS